MAYFPRPRAEGNFPEIVKLFQTAKQKLARPRVQMSIEGVSFVIYPAGVDSKNRGYLYVKRKGENGDYVGKIAPNGDFFPAADGGFLFAQFLERFNSDPVGCATLYGKQNGHCCFCGLELTDGRSVAVGYGPICAANYGLPWGEVKIEPTVELADLQFDAADLQGADHTPIAQAMPGSKEEMATALSETWAKKITQKNPAEDEEYAYSAMYYLSQELEQYLEPHNVVPMTASEMASTIVQELYNHTKIDVFNLVCTIDYQRAIEHLLTTYPIRKE